MADEISISHIARIEIATVFSVAVLAGLVLLFNCVTKKRKKNWKEESIYGQGVSHIAYAKEDSNRKNDLSREESTYGEGVKLIHEKERKSTGEDEQGIHRKTSRNNNTHETSSSNDSAERTKAYSDNYPDIERNQVGSATYAMVMKPDPKSPSIDDEGLKTYDIKEADHNYISFRVPRIPPSRPPPVLKRATNENSDITEPSATNDAKQFRKSSDYENMDDPSYDEIGAHQQGRRPRSSDYEETEEEDLYSKLKDDSDDDKIITRKSPDNRPTLPGSNSGLRDCSADQPDDDYVIPDNFRNIKQHNDEIEMKVYSTNGEIADELEEDSDGLYNTLGHIKHTSEESSELYGHLEHKSKPIPASPEGVYDKLKYPKFL